MPRVARDYYLSSFYHVMVQGDEKKFIFDSRERKEKYYYYIQHNAFRNDVEIIAYCIMDNHVHLLLYSTCIDNISKMMLQSNTAYGLYFNRSREKIGHVFRERFKSEPIYTKYHLINCIKYIHENPIKAKLCDKCGEYGFSSYRKLLNMQEYLLEICELDIEELKMIFYNTHTDLECMDYKSGVEDFEKIIAEISEKYSSFENSDDFLAQIYSDVKKCCNVSDDAFAKHFGISRYKLLRILKRKNVK